MAEIQVCPEFRYLQICTPSKASSKSASSKTIKGAFPPSSKLSLVRLSAQERTKNLPTNVDPVKLIFLTIGLEVRAFPISGASFRAPVTTLNTPAGTPASSASVAIASADSGVVSAGFKIIQLPAANAGAALRVTMAEGKFHGVIPAQTPIGCFITKIRESVL